MHYRKHLAYLLGFISVSLLISCDNTSYYQDIYDNDDTESNVDEEQFQTSISEALLENCDDHSEAADYIWNADDVVSVRLNDGNIEIDGIGATSIGSVLTITAAGTYEFTGKLTDGQIMVNTSDEGTVRLLFNGVDISNSTSAPVFISNADKTIIVLNEETENFISDAENYVYESDTEDEPNATIFSKDDLSFYGTGSLTINANYNDAITSKDGLVINSGVFTINAVDDGIRGKDYLIVEDGTFDITAGGDGLKSDNDEDETKGYVYIKTGLFSITSGSDGIQTATDLLIAYCDLEIISGGGSAHSVSSDASAKGLKSSVNIIIDDGTFILNSADDAVHSNGILAIYDGTFTLSTADDGLHADSDLTINGGTIDVLDSYEGIESEVITINAGTIHLSSSDDGINAANGESEMMGFGSVGSCVFNFNGGYLYVDANGDGLDANGAINMTGGTVLVNGPTNNGNGPLDYDGSFDLSGGFLVAVGSSGMAQAPGTNSSQYGLLLNFTNSQSANTMIHIQNSNGETILDFIPTKSYQSLVFSSSNLQKDESYDVFLGGTSSGTNVDGLIEDGDYSGGSSYTSFTISSIITQIGSSGGGPGGRG